MLDDLLGWIAAADTRMSTTEATPIGTNIETVERQLSEHEVRGLASKLRCVASKLRCVASKPKSQGFKYGV